MMRWMVRVALPPVIAFVAIVVLWEAAVKVFAIKSYFLPAPRAIAAAIHEHARTLLWGAWITGRAAGLGFLASAVMGVVIAMVLSWSRWLERAVYPFTIVFQTVPLVAIAPLLTIIFDFGLQAIVVSACIVSIFPVITNTLAGLRSVDPALIDLFTLYGSGRVARLFKLMLPSSLPSIFTGLRIAAGLSVIGTIVAELSASIVGEDAPLGAIISTSIRASKGELTFAAIVVTTLLGLAFFGIINAAGYLLLRRWHASAQERA